MSRQTPLPVKKLPALWNLGQELRAIDLVLELLDARAPQSSCNPQLLKLVGEKRRLILLHKADRGEPALTESWLKYFRAKGLPAMPCSLKWQHSLSALLSYLRRQRESARVTRLKRPLRIIIVGIPNVGKSSLINRFVKRSAARTGHRPGITRGKQWIRLLPGVELLDTPGLLTPNLSASATLPLAAIAALPAGAFRQDEVADWLLSIFCGRGKEQQLFRRYGPLQMGDPASLLEQIGLAQGCLLPGGAVDKERAAALLLRDFQDGSLGRLTLEMPPEAEANKSEPDA